MLDGNVLVLNRLFQPIQVTSVRRAITLFYKGDVHAVDAEYVTYDFGDWQDLPPLPDQAFITTPTRRIAIPDVIQLLRFDRMPRQDVKFSRGNIYLRDHNRCQYCGRKFPTAELSLDHVKPVSRGGRSTWHNVVCACLKCNVRKGNKLLAECGMRLIKHPIKPKWHPLHRLKSRPFPETWKSFLDQAYWNVALDEE